MGRNGNARLIDVAERAGVSRAVVGRVLLGTGAGQVRVGAKKAEVIRKVAAEMNFQPDAVAQMLAGKKSRMVGVLIDNHAPSSKLSVLSAIERRLSKYGVRMAVGQSHDDHAALREYISDFSSRRMDAFICIAHEYPEFDIYEDLRNTDNVVFLGRPKHDVVSGASYVDHDVEKGMELAVRRLAERDVTRIAVMRSSLKFSQNIRRMASYERTLSTLGLRRDPDLIHEYSGEPSDEKLEAAVDALVSVGRAEGVVVGNDEWALHFIKHLKRRGIRVPDDVAVVGFDNSPVGLMVDPELTTVDFKCVEQGELVASIVLSMIDGGDLPLPARTTVEPELVVRSSG